MKTNFKIEQKVKTQDGDIATIIGIYERDKAPNEILIHLEEIDIDIMENEIKVGDYCRTSAGKIFKCSEIVLGNIPKDENKTMIVQHIVKHSFNLIDLIQCGDYVNGKKVTEIKEWKSSKDSYFKYAVTCHYEIIRADEIKTIVTKEMMESISYRVERNN